MATERRKMPKYDDGKTMDRVSDFAAKNGYSEAEAKLYLCQYALNRLAVLAHNAAKMGPAKPRKASKARKERVTTRIAHKGDGFTWGVYRGHVVVSQGDAATKKDALAACQAAAKKARSA